MFRRKIKLVELKKYIQKIVVIYSLDFRIAQHGEIVNVFILVVFQVNFTMLNILGWILELHSMVKLSTFSFW